MKTSDDLPGSVPDDLCGSLHGLATETKFAVLCGLDFEPEDRPEGLIEAIFLCDERAAFQAGLYELRYVRPLEPDEWKARQYRDLIAKAEGRS